MQAALLNGQLIDATQPALYLNERGWQYGDGLFETMLLRNGSIRFLDDHIERLQTGCVRLGMPALPTELILKELQLLCGARQHGVIKLTLTRGRGERGYRPSMPLQPTRLLQLFATPAMQTPSDIRLRWCATRLSRNALLAGIKHCNRLEQVLAQAEWYETDIAEGLMLDTEGELISATMHNVFLVLDGVLVTPDLRYSGVAGIMRKNVLRLANALQIENETRAVRAEEILAAQEVFICNAVRGIRPVIQLEQQCWPIGDLTRALMNTLQE
ncbi:MAG: aminodeoxychorismate lyase [Steroidobacteraceae bacterium]